MAPKHIEAFGAASAAQTKLIAVLWVSFVSCAALLPASIVSFAIVYKFLEFPFFDFTAIAGFMRYNTIAYGTVDSIDTTKYRITTDSDGKPIRTDNGGILVVDKELERQAKEESARAAREVRRGSVLFWALVAMQVLLAFVATRRYVYRLGRGSRVVLSAIGGFSAGVFVGGVATGTIWIALTIGICTSLAGVKLHAQLDSLLARLAKQAAQAM